jgi:hypothetical protein
MASGKRATGPSPQTEFGISMQRWFEQRVEIAVQIVALYGRTRGMPRSARQGPW